MQAVEGQRTLERNGVYGSLRLGPGPDELERKAPRTEGDLSWHELEYGEDPDEPRDNVQTQLLSTVQRIYKQQDWRRRADLHHARMYSAVEMPGLGRRSRTPVRFSPSRLAFNVTKSACDTLVSKIAKNRPLPMFLTSGGNWKQKRKAKGLSRYVEGQFEASRVFETLPAVVLDTSVYGTGFAKVVRDGSRIVVDRIYPWEILVDECEGIYGDPACMYQLRWVSKRVLMRRYPEKAALIRGCAESFITALDARTKMTQTTSDQILTVEAWCLGDEENPGRRSLCIANATLEDEPCARSVFPIIALRRQVNLEGFFGIGVCQELQGIQYEINVMATKLQRSHHILGSAIWMVPDSAGVPTAHITNDVGLIMRFKGLTPPTAVTPEPVAQGSYNYLLQLIQKAYDLAGISALSATSEKPAGLNASVALETYSDIESERFIVFGRNVENFCIEIARHMVHLGREIAEDEPTFSVKSPRKGIADKIVFKDVELPDDELVIQVYPTSMLAKTPAARLEQVNTLAQNGWISADEAKMLLDFPDLESVTWRQSASYRMAEKIIDDILEDAAWTPPLPVMNLSQARTMSLLAYLDAYQDGVEPEHLEMLLEWADACLLYAPPVANQQQGAPAAPAQPTPPQGPPPAQQAPEAAPPTGTPMPAAA